MYGVYSNSRSSARNGTEKTGFSEMVAAAGFDTRNLQVLSNQCPGGPLPDKGSELDKGLPLLLPLLGLRCERIFCKHGTSYGLSSVKPGSAAHRLPALKQSK